MKNETYLYLLSRMAAVQDKLDDYRILTMYLLFKLGGQYTVRLDEFNDIFKDISKLCIQEVPEGYYLKLMSVEPKETK